MGAVAKTKGGRVGLKVDEIADRIEELPGKIIACRESLLSNRRPLDSELGRKVAEFCEGSTSRFCVLVDDVVHLFRDRRVLAISMCARGAVETAGILAEFRRKFQNALDPVDETEVVSVARNFLFASKEFGASREVATPHVLNGVRALDRDCSGVFNAYEILCESVHPNWAGRLNVGVDATEIDAIAATRIHLASLYLTLLFDVVVLSHSRCVELAEKHQGTLARLMLRPKVIKPTLRI